MEMELYSNLRFMNFLDYPDKVPDVRTIWLFRERLYENDRNRKIWKQFLEKGIMIKTWTIRACKFSDQHSATTWLISPSLWTCPLDWGKRSLLCLFAKTHNHPKMQSDNRAKTHTGTQNQEFMDLTHVSLSHAGDFVDPDSSVLLQLWPFLLSVGLVISYFHPFLSVRMEKSSSWVSSLWIHKQTFVIPCGSALN